MLMPFELFVEDDVLAGQQEGGWQEVVLVGLVAVALLIEGSFIFFEIFAEHIFTA